ncbi:odd-skipped - related [Holotrichia oblita]|uniref:Odd-skipped - related n=1 Tax=Holotrichia oblita TaxID=644536 RepID=A0ACB9SPD3_HOLOL|nr:odd-skipped - related [Holotrichia oblita]
MQRKVTNYVAKERTLAIWQDRWEKEEVKAQWTKRLIRVLKAWIQCKHRNVDYYLTQALTAHGCYRAFTKRIRKDVEDGCIKIMYTKELDERDRQKQQK